MKIRKAVGALLLTLFLLLVFALTWAVSEKILSAGIGGGQAKEYFASFGKAGWLVALGLQILQILVAFIPGELVETGMGYAFGALWGTLLCYTGLAIGQTLVFVLIRTYGVRALHFFVPEKKREKWMLFREQKHLKQAIFLLFLLPGTPKDLFCYLVPLSRVRLSEFLCISLIARLPSVVSSTVGGSLLSEGNYRYAAILYAASGLLALVGMRIYNLLLKKKEAHHALTKSF